MSTKFQEYDRTSTQVKACTLLRPVLVFLWAVHKKLVPPLIVAVDLSPDGVDWSARFYFAYILPKQNSMSIPPFPLPPP
ncbi:MAG: hypothetical protein ACK53Y_16230, partial [bacterium]